MIRPVILSALTALLSFVWLAPALADPAEDAAFACSAASQNASVAAAALSDFSEWVANLQNSISYQGVVTDEWVASDPNPPNRTAIADANVYSLLIQASGWLSHANLANAVAAAEEKNSLAGEAGEIGGGHMEIAGGKMDLAALSFDAAASNYAAANAAEAQEEFELAAYLREVADAHYFVGQGYESEGNAEFTQAAEAYWVAAGWYGQVSGLLSPAYDCTGNASICISTAASNRHD